MDQQISLTLGLEKVNLILEALGALPYTKSAPLIDEIRSQAVPQLQQPVESTGETQSNK